MICKLFCLPFLAFKVLNYDREADVFTGSRLAALDHMAAITLKKIEVGDEIIAVVRSVSPSLSVPILVELK